ncbi:MAG TPA: hypothetical protein VNS58_15175 [Puia sp.]|nr:hypothetical protein [Puia sp.]
MSTKQEHTSTNELSLGKIDTSCKINYNMRDYSNDPFVIRKGEAAQRRLEKVGFPKEVLEQLGLPPKE